MTGPRPTHESIKGKEKEHADTLGYNPADPFGDALRDKLEIEGNPKISKRIKSIVDSTYNAEAKKMLDKKEADRKPKEVKKTPKATDKKKDLIA